MKKIFHIAVKPGGMVVWNINGKAVLIAKEHFREIVESLLQDQDDGDQNLNMFCLRITLHTRLGDEKLYDVLQEILNKRLFKKVKDGSINFHYRFLDKDAKNNVEDFLETYKYNTGHVFYAVGVLHDDADDVINISLRNKPTVFQKLRGQLGDPYKEINILRNNISELEGNSFEFKIKLISGKELLFSDNGVHFE